jgi:hypothetical protein
MGHLPSRKCLIKFNFETNYAGLKKHGNQTFLLPSSNGNQHPGAGNLAEPGVGEEQARTGKSVPGNAEYRKGTWDFAKVVFFRLSYSRFYFPWYETPWAPFHC